MLVHPSTPIKANLDGVTLLLKPSHSAPVVSIDFLAQVGAKEEPPEQAGLAHFIEHLLFRTREGGRATDPAKRLQQVGGEINGYTTHDFTCCTVTVASRDLDLALEVQSEIFACPGFRPGDVETERRIILQEIDLYEANPFQSVQAASHYRLFRDHPYGRPVHGFRRTVRKLGRASLEAFFRARYGRQALIVAAVGDFEPDRLQSRLAECLRPIRPLSSPPPSFSDPPAPPEPGRFALYRPLMLSYLDFLFPTVPMGHADFPGLCALGIILGGGRVSRTYRELQERRSLAHTTGAQAFAFKLAGFFGVSTTLQPGLEDSVRLAVQEQIQRLRAEPVTSEELAVARQKLEAASVFKNETASGQSFTLGTLACMAHPDYEEEFLGNVRALTPEGLLGLARRCLRDDLCLELFCGPRVPSTASGGAPVPDRPPARAEAPGKTAAPAPPEGPFSLVEEGPTRKVRLHTGVTLLLREDHTLPVVALAAFLKAGGRDDPPGKTGVAALTQAVLLRRTRRFTPDALSYHIESLGAELNGSSSLDHTRIDLYGLSRDFLALVQLLGEVLLDPYLDPADLEKLRAESIAEIQSDQDRAEVEVHRLLAHALFEEHPYGLDPEGTEESLSAITVEDIQAFYTRHYRGHNLVVVAVGDFDGQQAASHLAGVLAGLPAGPASSSDSIPLPPVGGPRTLSLRMDWTTCAVYLSFRLPPITHPDFPAIHVLTAILGGPYSSRLWQELRDRRGLVYSAGAESLGAAEAGVLAVSAATGRWQLREVTRILIEQVEDLRARACSDEEVRHARRYLVGSHELAHQGASAWADLLGSFESSGLGHGYDVLYPRLIEDVTPERVRRAAATYLAPDRRVLLTLRRTWPLERPFRALWAAFRGRK
ncbi:MAG: insulinase family protein [Planctomycetes bacterium]|nr:insulinase family protein [Planctomycetota bacterium]